MRAGAIPQSDPRLLTRAVLGLYNSIWHWYRPTGIVALTRIGEYFTQLALAMVGVPPDGTRVGAVGRVEAPRCSSSVTSCRSPRA